MAEKQSVNFLGQQRVDIPDLRAIESGVIFDFKSLLQCFVGNDPYILRGFTIPVSGISGPATSLQLVVDSAVVWVPGDSNGTFLRVEAGHANEVLATSNPKVVGSFSPGLNFVSIRFKRATDPTTNDLVSVWDVDSATEFTKTVPRGLVMDYEIVIDSTTFGDNSPIALVNVSGSNVTSITNAKTGLFRLGRGGASPDINYQHSYAVNPENNLTATTNASPDPFTGGDWELLNWKQWMDAVMTEFKVIKNSAFWYGTNTVIPNINLPDLFFDVAASKITGSGAWKHSDVTPGMMTWTSDLNLRSVFGRMSLTIAQGSVTLADGDVAYIQLVRNQDFQPANTFTFTNGSTSVTASLVVTGINPGDFIRHQAHNLTAWTEVLTVVGTTITLSNPYPGATAIGKALRTVGNYTVVSAAPNAVPVSSDTYWIAKRDDNGFAAITVAAPGSNGLARTGDLVTVNTTTPHGLVEGQSFALTGANDVSFDGHYDTETILSATSFTYRNGGPDVAPGIAGNGSIGPVAKIYMRMGGGVGELEEGEEIQIDDETVINILKFIGARSSADSSPQYSSNNYVTNGDSLATAIGDLDAAVGAISWKSPVANFAALPLVGNVDGDVRITLDTRIAYSWHTSDSSWKPLNGTGGGVKVIGGGVLTNNPGGLNIIAQASSGTLSVFQNIDNTSSLAAQSFTVVSATNLISVQAQLTRVGSPSGFAIRASIHPDNAGEPGLAQLALAPDISMSSFPADTTTLTTFTFTTPLAVSAATVYWVKFSPVIEMTGPFVLDGANKIDVYTSTASVYAGGNASASDNNGGIWTPDLARDMQFIANGSSGARSLSFTANMFLEFKGLAYADNTISTAQSPISFPNDLDVAYVIPNLTTGGPSLTVVVSALTAVPANAIIIARREGNDIIVGSSSTRVKSGESTKLYYTQNEIPIVRFIDPIALTLPVGTSYTADGLAAVDGDLILFTNLTTGKNRIYMISGVGTAIAFTAQLLYKDKVDPSPGQIVKIYDGLAFAGQFTHYTGTGFVVNDVIRLFDGVSANFQEISSIKSLNIVNNTTDNVFSVNVTNSENFIIFYSVLRGSGKETGQITLSATASAASCVTASAPVADPGIEFNANVTLGVLNLEYTTDNSGASGTMKYFVYRWSDVAGGPSTIPSYSSGPSFGPGAGGEPNVEYRTLSGGEATAEQLTLSTAPNTPSKVLVDVIFGSAQVYSVDYTVTGAVVSWAGLGLSGVLVAGDILRIVYWPPA